jgi:hypothetical protein
VIALVDSDVLRAEAAEASESHCDSPVLTLVLTEELQKNIIILQVAEIG